MSPPNHEELERKLREITRRQSEQDAVIRALERENERLIEEQKSRIQSSSGTRQSERMGDKENRDQQNRVMHRSIRNEPPRTFQIWILIKRGKILQHGVRGDQYDGSIRRMAYQKTSRGVVVSFISEKDPNLLWKGLLPREDGEYYITVYLVQ